MKTTTIVIFFLLNIISILDSNAQSAFVATGGNATGTNGKISYSIGQVDYVFISTVSGSINQGVQQPFEIFTLGNDNFDNIQLIMTIYPNPTSTFITLKIDNYNLETIKYQLLDLSGREIFNQKIKTSETIIDLQNYASATYLLEITDNSKLLKTFKIIKNN